MPRVYRRAAARRDLIEHYVYFAENAGVETAERFLTKVEQSFDDLIEHREIGVALTLRHSELRGLRKWRVKDFEKFLIFYLPRSDGISIVRVLHAAQDWWNRLGIIWGCSATQGAHHSALAVEPDGAGNSATL